MTLKEDSDGNTIEFTDVELVTALHKLQKLRLEVMQIHSKYWQHPISDENLVLSPYDLENNIIWEIGKRKCEE